MLRSNEPRKEFGPAFCVLGSFDGVHLGHQALLRQAKTEADGDGYKTVVVTFRQHPLSVLAPQRAPKLLSTGDERAAGMEKLGVDALVELDFTQQMSAQEPEEFIQWLTGAMEIRKMVVGYNYSFGKGGRGTPELLKKLSETMGFQVRVLEPVALEGEPVSSSRIRELLTQGKTMEAAKLLGSPYGLAGEIKKGKQLGRKLGFPTLNIHFPEEKAVPSAGVYTGWIRFEGGIVPAVTNIGTNPTVEDGPKLRLESHALEEIALVYGDRAEVFFGEKLREEQRFSSVEELRRQVMSDREQARLWSLSHSSEALDFGKNRP